MLQDCLGISQRRACRYVGQHRSTQPHEPAVTVEDQALRAELRRISRRRPRWGYRRAHQLLLQEGWEINRKRIQRLWRQEGLRVPQKRRKRQRLGVSRPYRPGDCEQSTRITCGRSTSSSTGPPTGTTPSCCTSWTSPPARLWRSRAA
jgi:transposase InsO family protein